MRPGRRAAIWFSGLDASIKIKRPVKALFEFIKQNLSHIRGWPQHRQVLQGSRARDPGYRQGAVFGMSFCSASVLSNARVVELQDVVLGKNEATDGCFGFQATMRAMPIVAMQPDRQLGGATIGKSVDFGIGPFT